MHEIRYTVLGKTRKFYRLLFIFAEISVVFTAISVFFCEKMPGKQRVSGAPVLGSNFFTGRLNHLEPLWQWSPIDSSLSNFCWESQLGTLLLNAWRDKHSHFFQVSEVEVLSARNELKLAVRRAEDLQVSKITLFTTTMIFNA